MEIRKLDVQENGKTRPLYEEVFSDDSTSFVDYYYTEKTKDNQIYVVEEDDAIRAMFHLNPYKIVVNGSEKDLNYIVAVATQREYRSRGYMAALMKQALLDMYNAGETFTYLMPAAEAIYLPHDFRIVYEQQLRHYVPEEKPEEGVMVSKAEACECEEVALWANAKLAGTYQVYAKRDEAYYKRLIKECESENGGLMLYRKGESLVDCRSYYGPGEEENDHENPKIMVRIVDVRRMLMAVKVKSLMAACFHITDPIIPENNRCIVITGTEFSGVMLMDGKPENSEGTITIAALASLIFGAKSVEEVCKEPGVEMSDRMKAEMEKLQPIDKIYLNEVV